MVYFVVASLKEVVDEWADVDSNIIYYGKILFNLIFVGIVTFVLCAPLTFVRKIEKFSWTYLIADLLILVISISIIVFSCLHVRDYGWG